MIPYLIKRNIFSLFLLAIVVALTFVSCKEKEITLDPMKRTQVDALNKASFMARYRNPSKGIMWADSALTYIADSLPDYEDGYLRACNNRAFCSYMLSDYKGVRQYCDSVFFTDDYQHRRSPNHDIEQVLAKLLKARMLQRRCDISASYLMLNDVERSGLLNQEEDNFLVNLAQSEYYITSLILNYHYRNGGPSDGMELLREVENRRSHLKCDYAQDMAMNYAMAHSYSKLCDSVDWDKKMRILCLDRSLSRCIDNLLILSNPAYFCNYQLADVMQMVGFICADTLIDSVMWKQCEPKMIEIEDVLREEFKFDLSTSDDWALSLLQASYQLFWQIDDPYQHLGASVALADYSFMIGDTVLAKDCLLRTLNDSTMPSRFAPKFEAIFYQQLINSGMSRNPYEIREWFSRELETQEFINQNQREDFLMRLELEESHRVNRFYLILVCCILFFLLVLLVLLFLLRHRTRALQRETERLQLAKRQDVERIANVETCLSVLRHDITPFISYLQNKKLPESLRQEVLEHLLHTFDNIKTWTKLSIPSGLQFRAGRFALSEVMEESRKNVVNLHPQEVDVRFEPTGLRVWADRMLLVILIRNLVSNAMRFTERGSIVVRAEIYAADERFVRVSVIDTGAGMDNQTIEDLFRTDKAPKSDEAKSTGFGLILSRYIIKKHDDNTLQGCSIWAESELGKGSQFHFLVARDMEAEK